MSCETIDNIAVGVFMVAALAAIPLGLLPVVGVGLRLRRRTVPTWQRFALFGTAIALGGLIAWQILGLSFWILEHPWQDTFGVACPT